MEVAVDLPGEPHAAVGLDVLLGREVVGGAGGDSRRSGRLRQLGRVGRQRPGAVIGVGAGELGLHIHVGQLVLDRLVAGDDPAEGVALQCVGPRHLQAAVRPSHLLEGEQHRGPVKDGGQHLRPLARAAEPLARRALEAEPPHAAGRIECRHGLARHTGSGEIDDDKFRLLRGPGQNDGVGGDVAVSNGVLDPAQPVAVHLRRNPVGRKWARRLGGGEAADDVAAGHAWQQRRFLRLAPELQHGLSEDVDGGGEGDRRHDPTQLLGDGAQLHMAESRTPIGLRDGGAGPAHLGHRPPERGVIALRRVVQDGPGGRGRAARVQELARLVLQELLVVGVVEIHQGRFPGEACGPAPILPGAAAAPDRVGGSRASRAAAIACMAWDVG